jgi:hypothetical protein
MKREHAGPDLLVECKVTPPVSWSDEVLTQLRGYIALYKPKNTMLVTLHEIGGQKHKDSIEIHGSSSN